MIEKSRQYTLINIYNNQILLLKTESGQYYLPQGTIYGLKKEYRLKEYRLGKIFTDKWFLQMDGQYQKVLKEIYFSSNATPYYIYVSDEKLDYPEADFLNVDFLLKNSFIPQTYPLLFGIAAKQLQLEGDFSDVYKKTYSYEKRKNLNYTSWIALMSDAINQGSYSISRKLLKIIAGKTTSMQEYSKILNLPHNGKWKEKASYIIDHTHIIFEELLSLYKIDVIKYISDCLSCGVCSLNHIIYYVKHTKNEERRVQLLYTYFTRTKDQDSLAGYIVFLTDKNDPEDKPELVRLLSLDFLQSSKKTAFIISHLFRACYYIMTDCFQEGFDELIDCYLNNYFNEANSKHLILSSVSLYRSIPVNYKYIMLYLIQRLYELNLAEFTEGNTILTNIFNDYNQILHTASTERRMKQYYLKEAVNKVKKDASVNIGNLKEQEKIAFALKNMSAEDFRKIKSLTDSALSNQTKEEIHKIIRANLLKS